MRILLVEDEPAIADTLVYALQSERFEVVHALTGKEALRQFEQKTPELVILDIGLPDMTGLEVCKAIRQKHATPILFLTARDGEIDRILGLELGGDDYVTKPFSPREIVARIRAILRRSQATSAKPASTCASGPLSHDAAAMNIHCSGTALDLTAHEYKLLLVLIRHPGRVLTRDQLLELAWDDPGAVTDRTIDAHIKTIRSKLRQIHPEAADWIQTRRGLGYAYVPST